MTVVFAPTESSTGLAVSQRMKAYEIRLSTHKPGDKWRLNHFAHVIAETIQEAISLCCQQWPDDPVIHQAVLRNNAMTTIISGTAFSGDI